MKWCYGENEEKEAQNNNLIIFAYLWKSMSKHLTVENIAQYIAEINMIYMVGDTTEHTYRPALESLLEKMTNGLHLKHLIRYI